MDKKAYRVDVVIPVYNEEGCLQKNVLSLYNYLKDTVSFDWNIIVADNSSTDKTPEIAKDLSGRYKEIIYAHVPKRGRGRALREMFLDSKADIVCYMDVDLSSNLRYFNLLIEGIVCGFDIAVGSRLMRASRTKRRLNREIISRIYNLLIRVLFWNSFSDAQCGFKALKTDVAKRIIPLIKNNNWFFDTELLLLAEYNRLRIFEVPVEWIQDIKTKVHITKTVLEDLLGLLRMRCSIHKKRI